MTEGETLTTLKKYLNEYLNNKNIESDGPRDEKYTHFSWLSVNIHFHTFIQKNKLTRKRYLGKTIK